jgi:hypothetical protein
MFTVKSTLVAEPRFEKFATEQEAYSRLFETHGQGLHVEIYKDDALPWVLGARLLQE